MAAHNPSVSVEAQNRGKVLLCGREPERPDTEIVGPFGKGMLHVFGSVRRGADDFVSDYPPGFGRSHIGLAEVYTVGPDGIYESDTVIDDECAPYLRHSRPTSAPVAINSSSDASFMRSCTQRHPPRSTLSRLSLVCVMN